jgi:hypothetical protein
MNMEDTEKPVSNGAWCFDLTPTLRTAEDCAIADEKHRQISESQKSRVNEIADKLEASVELSRYEAEFAAAVLRGAAKGFGTKKEKRRGKPDILPGDINMNYAVKISGGASREQAIAAIAEEFSVSTQAVRKKLKKMGAEAFLRWANVDAKK